jgi:hypothetical protein
MMPSLQSFRNQASCFDAVLSRGPEKEVGGFLKQGARPRVLHHLGHLLTLLAHGPTLFAGLSKRVDLKLVSRLELGSGAVAMRYEPRR